MLSKNAEEVKRRDGQDLDDASLKSAMVPIGPLKIEMKKLGGQSDYIAQVAADIDNNTKQFKVQFSRSKPYCDSARRLHKVH